MPSCSRRSASCATAPSSSTADPLSIFPPSRASHPRPHAGQSASSVSGIGNPLSSFPMQPIISIADLSKTYASGFQALKRVNLDIRRGEIFALLGPNGAGKTTLISIICGIVMPTAGVVSVDGHDIITRLPRRALDDRSRAAGADHRRVRDGLGHRHASAAGCSASRPTPRISRRCSRTFRCGTGRTARS